MIEVSRYQETLDTMFLWKKLWAPETVEERSSYIFLTFIGTQMTGFSVFSYGNIGSKPNKFINI